MSRYVTNGPIKQEGICLFPQHPHPQPYRMMPPQRADGYHVGSSPSYVPQQQPNQANNQVQSMRAMPPTVPPSQSSTPPNSDLKVQQMSQQASMNIAFVPQAQVRGGPTQTYYARPPPTSTQTPRMANHRQAQPSMYQTQSAQFVPLTMQPMYLNTPAVQYFNGGPRPQTGYVAPGFQMIPSQHITSYPYPQPQSQTQTYYYNTQLMPRPPPPVASTPQNPTQQPAPNMSFTQPAPQHGILSNKKRRSNAIPIIDPDTGKDKLSEMYEQEQDDSHPPSGESSARQTPQPSIPNSNKEVQAAFAKQVAQAISSDEVSIVEEMEPPPPIIEHLGHPLYHPPPPQHPRFESIVQSSKLQAATKEFVPAGANSSTKESTPVVSAITDAVEVTINTTNKPKDRESPAKARKQREQITSREREHKDSIKEIPLKDVLVCENPISYSKDDNKQKDNVVLNTIVPNKEVFVQHDDKKTQKPDKVEVKLPSLSSAAVSEDNLSDSGLVIPVSATIPEITSSNSKSKHNTSHKNKEPPKQVPLPQQPPPPASIVHNKPIQPTLPPIPVTQPSKPTNKANNKMRDLNVKSVLKEDADMDLLNENEAVHHEHDGNTTNHSNSSSINTDYVNTNTVMLNNNSNINSTLVNNDTNKRTDSNDSTTIKSVPEIKTKSKIDITDIVKDVPKPFKSIVVPPVVPTESSDEPDHAVLANDKLVQAKNEANAKANAEVIDTTVAEIRPNLPYKEDQWSPFNPQGKKVYEPEFLLALRTDPKSKRKPDNLHADIAVDERVRVGDMSRLPMSNRMNDFAPFGNNNYSGKSSSQRGNTLKKGKGSQGSIGGGSSKDGKRNIIRLSISVKEDVQLHETENAWKPARFEKGANMSEDEKKTEELYKKVRGVLNKLTPQKFETLLSQVRDLNIDTMARLQGVIDLVFEKATDEPNFSVAYALLCRQLALMQVPVDVKRKEEFVNFRKLLVSKCQQEFEKNSINETERNTKLVEIEDCADPEKKKDLQLELEEYDRKLRMKSVGNIRFIGELFKQQMLTVNIMSRCLSILLKTRDEESLECLCKLLTTIGKDLEIEKKVDLSPYFTTMKEIAEKKDGKVSSRVRFMIQDVIDLQLSRWVPRRQDLNPKTMDQIQKEAETEHNMIQAMNSVPITPRRDERSSNSTMNTNIEKKHRGSMNEEDWSTPRGGRVPQFAVKFDKLKNKLPMMDEPLGNSRMFGSWCRGSNIKAPQPSLTSTGNKFAVLETMNTETEKRPNLGLRSNKDTYNSKSPSLERYKSSYEDGRGSRSGSQQRSRDNLAASQSKQAYMPPPAPLKAQPPPTTQSVVIPTELSHEMKRRLRSNFEEQLNDGVIDECDQYIKSISPTLHPQIVFERFIDVLERSETARNLTGVLFANLIQLGTISIQEYCSALDLVLQEANELTIDIPKVWQYLAELIAPNICEGVTLFSDLLKAFKSKLNNGNAAKLLSCIFILIIKEKGPNFLKNSWNNSGVTFSNFMDESQIDSYVKENEVQFLLPDSNCPITSSHIQNQLSYEEIHNKLLSFFKSNTSFDDITSWVLANVGERVKENQFIRTLATAIFEYSIVNMKLKDEILQGKYSFFNRYADNQPVYELQCLYALQALINGLEHPQGLLLAICNKLFEDNVFSQESFIAWEESKDPLEQEGKGVTLLQLTSFFTQLKEADEESSSASEDV